MAQNAVSNSFEEVLKQTNPDLKYRYIDSTQTHNYSGNWDFDSDGKSDSVYFVGNGGAHLYFNLKIILSSNEVADLSFVSLDMPIIASEEDLKLSGYNPVEMLSQFAVYDFDNDGRQDIFIHLDSQSEIPRKLKRSGITKKYFLIYFEGKSVRFKNFVSQK